MITSHGYDPRFGAAVYRTGSGSIICVRSIEPSESVADHPGAVDAELSVDDVRGDVTLLPRQSDGVLDSWGSLEHWATQSLHRLPVDTLHDIVTAVRAAARSGSCP